MILHDLIKIKYIKEGYLPNHPYHLISDREMIDAFCNEDGYFQYNYPCIDESLREQYNTLKSFIYDILSRKVEDSSTEIPPWVYSYMLGQCISINSSSEDILMMYNFFNMKVEDNTSLDFNSEVFNKCYIVSDTWLRKLGSQNYRPPCMFGEPHVIKALRLNAVILV